jgi:hypothetical protein
LLVCHIAFSHSDHAENDLFAKPSTPAPFTQLGTAYEKSFTLGVGWKHVYSHHPHWK